MKKIKNNENGLTFVEVIIVVVIVGILSYVVGVNLTDASLGLIAETAMHKITSDVRYAQQMALSKGQGVRFYVDLSSNRYYLKWSDDTYLENPNGGADFIVEFGAGEFSQIQISATDFTNGRLDFDTGGHPNNSGISFAGEKSVLTLNNTKQLFITAGTGHLRDVTL